jgi:hypothetical protein
MAHEKAPFLIKLQLKASIHCKGRRQNYTPATARSACFTGDLPQRYRHCSANMIRCYADLRVREIISNAAY